MTIEPLAAWEGDRMPCSTTTGGAKENRTVGAVTSGKAGGARGAGVSKNPSARAIMTIEPLAAWERDRMPCSSGIAGAKENRTVGASASRQAGGARGAGDGPDAAPNVSIEPLAAWERDRMPCSTTTGGAKENRTVGASASRQAGGARGAGDGKNPSARAIMTIEPLAAWERDRMPCSSGIAGAKENRAVGAVASSQAGGARGAGDRDDQSTRTVIEPLAAWEGDRVPCSTTTGGAKENRAVGAFASPQAGGARGAGDGPDPPVQLDASIEPLAAWERDRMPCSTTTGGAKENRAVGAFASPQAGGARGAGDRDDRSGALAVRSIEPLAQWEGDRVPCRCRHAHKRARKQGSL